MTPSNWVKNDSRSHFLREHKSNMINYYDLGHSSAVKKWALGSFSLKGWWSRYEGHSPPPPIVYNYLVPHKFWRIPYMDSLCLLFPHILLTFFLIFSSLGNAAQDYTKSQAWSLDCIILYFTWIKCMGFDVIQKQILLSGFRELKSTDCFFTLLLILEYCTLDGRHCLRVNLQICSESMVQTPVVRTTSLWIFCTGLLL